jgi:glucokinase
LAFCEELTNEEEIIEKIRVLQAKELADMEVITHNDFEALRLAIELEDEKRKIMIQKKKDEEKEKAIEKKRANYSTC